MQQRTLLMQCRDDIFAHSQLLLQPFHGHIEFVTPLESCLLPPFHLECKSTPPGVSNGAIGDLHLPLP